MSKRVLPTPEEALSRPERRFVTRTEVAECATTSCHLLFEHRVTYFDSKIYSGDGPHYCPACQKEAQAQNYRRLAMKHDAKARTWRAAARARQPALTNKLRVQNEKNAKGDAS